MPVGPPLGLGLQYSFRGKTLHNPGWDIAFVDPEFSKQCTGNTGNLNLRPQVGKVDS